MPSVPDPSPNIMAVSRNQSLYGAVDDSHSPDSLGDGQLDERESLIQQQTGIRLTKSASGSIDNVINRREAASVWVAKLSTVILFIVMVATILYFGDSHGTSVYHTINLDIGQQNVQFAGNHELIENYIRLKRTGGDTDTTSSSSDKRMSSSDNSSDANPDIDIDIDIELFYTDQPVDHFDKHDHRTWSNRYYQSTKYFAGPGSPILMIVGGEGSLDHGILYPYVKDILAAKFGAAVLQIEHVRSIYMKQVRICREMIDSTNELYVCII
jgi:hypothetical protein